MAPSYLAGGTPGRDGALEVLEGACLLPGQGRGSPKTVMYTRHQYLSHQSLSAAPIDGEAGELSGGDSVVGLQVSSGGQQGQFGAVRMML